MLTAKLHHVVKENESATKTSIKYHETLSQELFQQCYLHSASVKSLLLPITNESITVSKLDRCIDKTKEQISNIF